MVTGLTLFDPGNTAEQIAKITKDEYLTESEETNVHEPRIFQIIKYKLIDKV